MTGMQYPSAADTTTLDYWLNWRVLLCAIWVFTPMIVAFYILRKYESFPDLERRKTKLDGDHNLIVVEDAWRPCLNQINPAWLLGFRVFGFCYLMGNIYIRMVAHGWRIHYYYTQLTFNLVAIYFGLGSFLSFYGCYQNRKLVNRNMDTHLAVTDAENGYYLPLTQGESTSMTKTRKSADHLEMSKVVRVCSQLFQIIFQMSAGAVVLTDCVYWSIIYPFLAIKDYELNFMTVNLHTSNLILLLCDAALNCLNFPWFRMSYFVLWTGVFVIFQWIIHACISLWWPYPFLDLSSPTAPLWYLLVAVLHLPCYGLFGLFVNIKQEVLRKFFPDSYTRPE